MDRIPGDYNSTNIVINTEQNVEKSLDASYDNAELKSTLEGLRDSSLLNPELQMLVSNTISSWILSNSKSDQAQRMDGEFNPPVVDGSGTTSGSEGVKQSLRQVQNVMSETSVLLQKVMDYLSLSGTERKEALLNPGLEYEGVRSTINGVIGKIKIMDRLLQDHFSNALDKTGLHNALQFEIPYMDASLIVVERSLQFEIARLQSQ